MVKTVVWTKRAVAKLDEMVQYLETEVSERTAQKFVVKVLDKIEILKKNPEIGRRSKKRKTIRFYKIDKHKVVYYRKQGATLFVVFFFDTRQHPTKNPY